MAVHEPFSDLAGLGETDVEGRPFDSPVSLLAWLADQTHDFDVFLKDTPNHQHHELLARRFLAEAQHANLIRVPRRSQRRCLRSCPTWASTRSGSSSCTSCTPQSATPVGTAQSSSIPTTSSHDPRRRWRRTARPSSCRSSQRRSRGSRANDTIGDGPHAGTWTSAPAPASCRASACIPHRRELRRAGALRAHHLPFYKQLHAQRLDVAAWEPVVGS